MEVEYEETETERGRATARKYEYKKCIKELAKHNTNSDSSDNPNLQVVVS